MSTGKGNTAKSTTQGNLVENSQVSPEKTSETTPAVTPETQLGTYHKKIVVSEVSEFVRALGIDIERAKLLSDMESKGFSAIGLLVSRYLEECARENAEDRALLENELDAERTRSIESEVAADIASDPSRALELVTALPSLIDAHETRIAELEKGLADLSHMPALLAREDYVAGMQYGQVRTAGTTGKTHGDLSVGVYRAILGKHGFRVSWKTPSDYTIYLVKNGIPEKLADYASLAEHMDEDSSAQIASITRARKLCKAALGYRGLSGAQGMVCALNASFELLSAGNHNAKNWVLVHNDPVVYDNNAARGILPKEA